MGLGTGHDPSSSAFDREGGDSEPSPLLRFVLVTAIVGALFFSGVYWFRLQVATGGGAAEATTVVQVHLLPRADTLPIPAAPATQSVAAEVRSPASNPIEAPATISVPTPAARPSRAPSISQPAASSTSLRSSNDATPNSATLEFKNALLRHIAKFQRYPKSAERQRLQGTVQAVFSVSRDGRLLDAWVKTSSGEAELDKAAIDTIRRAQPLPVIPSVLPDPIKIELALGFDSP
jgi:periplasmic protein TonB